MAGKLIFMMSVSLDGYFAGPSGELDWQNVDTELHQHFNDELRGMGAFLDGRVTWELMAGFWPTADADPAASAPMAEFAGIWREMPKVVYSRTLREAGWNTTVALEVDPAQVRELAERAGGDLVIGGAVLAETFRQLDMIDEYRIYVHPILLGQGRQVFSPAEDPAALTLVQARAFGSGVVLLRYHRADLPA
ncbi:MAG TPA: dihydrofolate reductase family protein [Streptosporangiaceae bacterium]|jgi:dihydrofolate reductase